MANPRSRKYASDFDDGAYDSDKIQGLVQLLLNSPKLQIVLGIVLGFGIAGGWGLSQSFRTNDYTQGLEKRVKDLADSQALLQNQRNDLGDKLRNSDQSATEKQKSLEKQLTDAELQLKSRDASIKSICASIKRSDRPSQCPHLSDQTDSTS